MYACIFVESENMSITARDVVPLAVRLGKLLIAGCYRCKKSRRRFVDVPVARSSYILRCTTVMLK